VWCPLDESPYFAALADAVTRQLGAEAAAGLRAVFALSDETQLRSALEEAALPRPSLAAHELRLELPPLERFVPRHLAATPVAPAFAAAPAAARDAVVSALRERLGAFATRGGLCVPFRSWLACVELPRA
jgi:hypothetical protein